MPELQEIDDWAAINEISDPAEKLAGFSNYVKGEFFKEGLGSEEMRETFKSINDSMVVRAAEEGVGLDQLGSLLQSKAPTFEEKMSLVDMAFSGIKNESDKEKIRDYNAFSSVLQKQPEESGFLTDKVEKLRVLAEEAVNNSYEDAVQWALNNSAIPFARVELSNGDVQLQAGDAAIGLSASESYQKSLAAGTVTPNDMEMIFRLTQKDENGYEAFRHLNLQEASAYVSKLSGGKISEDAEATPNSGSSLIKRSIKSLVTSYASAGKLGGVIDSDRLDVLVTTIRSVDESAYNYSQKDLKASLEFLIGSEAMLSGAARFDKDNLENNIKSFGYGSRVMHQKLLTSPVKFEGAIQGFGEKEKESLRAQRELTRESLFSDFSDALARSTYGDEWSSFYADRKGSLSDPDILDSFIENTEYDFSNKLQHIFLSVGEGFTDLAWAIGTVGGSKEARDYMVENLRDRQARATVAELFGQGFGLGTELSVTVAPIIADIVATAGITVATGGLGSAAVVAAVGAKNVFKAGVKTAVRTTLKRTAKKAPLRRAGGGQWRGTTGKRITPSEFYKEFGETLTKDFGKSYSKIASSKVVGRTAMFISAGSRSGAMTYASVYDVLSRAPEGERLSDDEIHEKALVVGATAFALTGSITLGFSVIGKGGFEDFIIQGATTKQVTNVINRLARKELSDETQQKVLNSVLARGRKELLGKTTGFKKVIRSGFWESLEEGLDEGVNTLLQAGATDSKLSFTEFSTAVGMGAMYGGIIGSGMSIASSGYRKLTKLDSSPASLLFERQAENNFIKQGEKELKDSGSPVAAKEFAKQVREAPNRVAQSNKPKETKEEVDAAGVEADAAGVEAEAAAAADEVYAEVEAEEEQAYDEARADADADAADAAAEVDAEAATVLYYLENANEEEIAEAIDAEKGLDNETAPESLDDSDSQPAQTLLDFQEDKGLTDDELQQAVEDYAEEAERGVPKKNVPVATKQKQQDNEDATAARLEELLALGYPINVADSSGRYGIPTDTTEFLKSRAAGFNATLEEQQKDKDSPYYIRTKEDVAKEHGVDVADIVEYALGFKHSDKGYLFTNDPKATDQLIKKGHKPRVSKDSDYNKGLFVVENGLVVGINKPVFSPNSTKAKDAKVEGVKDIVKKRITFNGSVNPTDTKIKLNAAGLFSNVIGRIKAEFSIDEEGSLVKKSISGKVKVEKPPTRKSDETDDDYLERVNQLELEKAMSLTNKSDYILDGEMTFKEALALFNKWVNENYEKLVESGQSEVAGQFRRASGIDRASFREQDVRDLMPHVVMEFVADLQHTIILAAVNAEVGSFIVNGVVSEENIVALSDSLVESGLFNQKEIEATLSGLGKLQFESGTTKDSDLLAKSETPKQKLASFLYYTLSGTSGIGNPFSNPEFKRDVDSTTKKKELKEGWENRIISRAVESMLAKEEFRPKEGDSFPNLPAIISKVGTRVRKREQKSTWQKESGVELNDNTQPVSPDPVETTTTYNEIRSQATNGINNEFKGLPPTEQNAAKESLVKLVIATETTPEYKPTEADLKGQDFREFLSAFLGRLTLKKGENSAVLKEGSPAHNFFSSVFDTLPPRLKNTLVVFGFDPPATFDADTLATTREAQDLILDSLNELTAPNLVSFKDAQKARDLNNVTIERLGLVDGDPESVINALEEIARNGVDESHRLMAELLLRDKPLIRKTRFRIVDNDRSKSAGSFVPFENESHRVSINVAGYYGSGIESVLIHEFIHAATYNLSRSDSLSTKQKAALKRLEGLRQLVKKSYVKSGMNLPSVENGVSSIDELLATIFTSNTFQEEVRSLPDGISFRRILNALKSLFGIKPESRLDKAFNDLVDFLNMDVAPKPRAIDSLGKRPKTSDADDVFQKKIEELESSSREGKNQRFSSFGGSILKSAPTSDPVDAAYLAAVESGDVEAQQRMVDEAGRVAGYSEKGARAGVYRGGEPLLPSKSGNLGAGYYAVLGGNAYDVRAFAGEIVGQGRSDKSLKSSVDNVVIDLGDKTIYLTDPSELGRYLKNNGLEESFSTWLDYQETVTSAYRAVDGKRPDSLETRRAGDIYRPTAKSLKKQEAVYREEGLSEPEIQDRLNYDKNLTYQDSGKEASFLFDRGLATSIIIDWSNNEKATLNYKEVAVANPNQIKSAEPVTKDESGAVIPLSQRFNEKKSNILYSAPVGGIQYDVSLTAEQEAIADELLDDVIKTTVPADVPIIELDEERTAEMFAARPKALFVVQMAELGGQEVATIFVNRPRLQQVMFGLTNEVTNGVHAKMILESILNEEITHAAELNVIPIEQIDAAASGMSVSDFDGIIESYTEDEALRQSLKEGVSKGDVEILRQMVGEKLRMEVQKINRGYTTEQDKAFYMSNPNFAKVMFRYLKGFFKRMYAKYNLRKDNAEMSRMVNQMSHEIQLLRSGVFHIRDTMEFDIAMPDYTGDFLNQRFSATFEDEALKEITPETTDEEIYNRFPFLKGFELPVGVFKDGKYTKNGKIKKFLNGELDPRILELRRQSDAVNMAVKGRAENLMGSAMKLIQEDPEATNQLLADFMGRPDSTQVSFEYRSERHKVSDERMIRERKEKGRPLNDSERDLIVKEEVDDAIAAENVRLLDVAKFKKATARQKLMSNNPELHESLNELRLLLDAISKKFSSEFDSHGELRAVVDANLGVYIIRSYRAFLEEGYMDKLIKITKGQAVAGDAQLVQHFEQVYEMFNEKYHESFASSERAKERKAEVPDSERTETAELIKTSEETVASLKEQGIDPIRGAILEYLYSLDPNSRFRDKSAPLATSPTKSLVDQMKARKSIPEVFRKFLGQYDEADVMDNVLRSISMVSRATAQESFTANIIKLGRPDNKKDQFVYTLDEVRALGLDLDLVNLRTGARAATSDIQPEKLSDEVEAKASKTSQYYVPREMYADMQKQFQRSSEGNLSTDKEVINKALELAKLGVGVSLASKTLFSVGFYLRNALGNVAFFAPLVGLSPLKVIAAHRKIAAMYRGNLKGLDNYMANLVRLNLVHGDMTSQTIMELMEGTTSLKDLESEQQELTSKLDKLLEAGKKVSDKTVAPVMKRMVALSQAIDSVYKIAYFENEIAVLNKARDSDIERGIAEGKGYNLSDEALQVKAAHIVRGTSQSYVDAYEIVKYATGKYSFLLPPFIRFRTDILRILLDGLPKQINSELRSDNPVIKSRGIKRLAGMSLVVVGAGMLAPVATRILAGLGKEEEEMLRNSLPDWQKNAALLFTGPDKFIDMTYVNPVSGVTNTTLAAISDVFDGRPIDGFFKGLSMLTQEYGGGQIVTSALLDVKANRDTRTGEQIHGGMDGGFGAFIDMTSYVFREAYAPRGGTALYRAGKAALGDQPLDDQKTTAMILAREFYPFKPRTIEWERVFQKSISSTKKESLRARNSIKKIMSSSSLTDWEINSAVDDFVEGQFEASAKLSRAMAAAKKMGVSSRQISSSLKYSKVSEDYANLTRRGIYERPSIPKSLVEDVRVSGDTTLRDRLLKANKRLRESPRYMRFDD